MTPSNTSSGRGNRSSHSRSGSGFGFGFGFVEAGTVTPRNDLIAPPQNRTDVRFQQRIPLGGKVSIDGIAEIFNAFNRPNWGIGTQESTPTQFLQHTSAQVRTAQVGFRLTF